MIFGAFSITAPSHHLDQWRRDEPLYECNLVARLRQGLYVGFVLAFEGVIPFDKRLVFQPQ